MPNNIWSYSDDIEKIITNDTFVNSLKNKWVYKTLEFDEVPVTHFKCGFEGP